MCSRAVIVVGTAAVHAVCSTHTWLQQQLQHNGTGYNKTLLQVCTASTCCLVCDGFVLPGVYLMSPMLHTLTKNISEDSVIAMIVGLCITHLFLHDYK